MSKTHVGFILDRSGSMHSILEATREGVIRYVKTLKKETPEALFTLTAFDQDPLTRENDLAKWLQGEPLTDVKITPVMGQYAPRGNTPLYDAVGATITDMRRLVKKDDKAIVVVMTDGWENASKEWDRESVFNLVTKLSKKGNWTFVYLGANVDAYKEARKMGVAAGNAVYYSATPGSTGATLDAAAMGTSHFTRSKLTGTQTIMADAGLKTDYRDEEDGEEEESSSGLWVPGKNK